MTRVGPTCDTEGCSNAASERHVVVRKSQSTYNYLLCRECADHVRARGLAQSEAYYWESLEPLVWPMLWSERVAAADPSYAAEDDE